MISFNENETQTDINPVRTYLADQLHDDSVLLVRFRIGDYAVHPGIVSPGELVEGVEQSPIEDEIAELGYQRVDETFLEEHVVGVRLEIDPPLFQPGVGHVVDRKVVGCKLHETAPGSLLVDDRIRSRFEDCERSDVLAGAPTRSTGTGGSSGNG